MRFLTTTESTGASLVTDVGQGYPVQPATGDDGPSGGVLAFVSVKLFGARGDGVHDDTGPLQAAFNALAGSGSAAWFPAGNYLVKKPLNVPSNLQLCGESKGSSTLTASLGVLGNPGNATLVAGPVAGAFSTTLAANSTQGSPVVSMAAAPSAGMLLAIQSAAQPLRAATYSVVSVSGVGPFTVTLDRPVLKQFLNGDTVSQLASVPVNIEVHDLVFAGVADRMIEFDSARRCRVEDCFFEPTGACDIVASFDVGGLENVFSRCYVFGAGVAGTSSGLALETNESSAVRDCEVRDTSTGYAIGLWDSDLCLVENCVVSNCTNGVVLTADGNTIGCLQCTARSCQVIEATQNGFLMDNGSSSCTFDDCIAQNCTTYGIYIAGTGTVTDNVVTGCLAEGCSNSGIVLVGNNTQVSNCTSQGNVGYALLIENNCTVDGFFTDSPSGTGCIVTSAASYTVQLQRLRLESVIYGFGVQVAAGVVCNIVDANIDAGNVDAVQVSGVCSIDVANLTSGTNAVHVESGGSIRMGSGVRPTAGAVTIDAGGHSNRGTFNSSNGTTNVAFPDLTAADKVLVQSTAAAPTGFVASKTVGTGFAWTDTGVHAYDYVIGP